MEFSKFIVENIKNQIMQEFSNHDRKGLYAYTQKNMAYNSNKIEGSALTSEQTASLFDTGTIIGSNNEVYRAKDVEEMTGHFKMFNEVLKNIGKPITIDMIKSFHFQLKSGVFEDYANGYPVGEFKNRVNTVSDIETAKPNDVSARVQDLLDRYNSGNKLFEDIVKFHAEYEHIHPFQDGNGRTGRAILLKQCLDSSIMPVIISDNEKPIYYKALHSAQIDKKYEPLTTFFLQEQKKYYNAVKEMIRPDLLKQLYVITEEGKMIINDNITNLSNEFLRLPDKDKVTSIDFGVQITNIADGTFANCKNLSAIDISEKLLADIDIDSVFKGTNLDMDKLHEIADNYREEHEQEFDDIENDATEDEDHDNL